MEAVLIQKFGEKGVAKMIMEHKADMEKADSKFKLIKKLKRMKLIRKIKKNAFRALNILTFVGLLVIVAVLIV
ncbi:MAG: hypothetical protein V3S79_06145 [Candidatus Thermoplasmatota archaeon]